MALDRCRMSLALAVLLICAGCAGQRLAPLRTGYPAEPLELPRDLAGHDWAQTEWWYYTGHLQSPDGARYGFELTFFRRRIDGYQPQPARVDFPVKSGLMAHFAIVDLDRGRYLHKGLIMPEGMAADADTESYRVRVKDWRAEGDENVHHLYAQSRKMGIELELKPLKPAVLHGDRGIVAKDKGLANYYMSYTRLKVSGKLRFLQKEQEVQGMAWFDHEYGYMGNTPFYGWDWYSIQLDDNTEYMIYAIRAPDRRLSSSSQACKIDQAGLETCVPYTDARVEKLGLWQSPHTRIVYPVAWRIQINAFDLDLIITPQVIDQEFRFLGFAYWEGSCLASGRPASGSAYVELVD